MDKKNNKRETEVYFFLQKIKSASSVLLDLKEIKNDKTETIFDYLAMKNCKQNWYTHGIPKKYKVILRLLELLKDHHKKAQELQKKVNEFIKQKNEL